MLPGNFWQYLETLWILLDKDSGGGSWNLVGDARDASKHPALHRTAITKNDWHKMHDAKTEKVTFCSS